MHPDSRSIKPQPDVRPVSVQDGCSIDFDRLVRFACRMILKWEVLLLGKPIQ